MTSKAADKEPVRAKRGSNRLTARTVSGIQPGQWLTAPASQGQGALQARGLAGGGVSYYLRITGLDGKQQRVKVGTNIKFAQAKALAAELSLRYQQGERDLRGALEREATAERAKHEADKVAEADKRTRTLGALLEAYSEQLERDGKVSAKNVRQKLRRLVRDAMPAVWAMPLADVDADALMDVIAAPVAAGHLRQGDILRQYIRAAFAAGIKARHNAKATAALRALRVRDNPAAALSPIEGAIQARDRALSLSELRAYWQRIQEPEHAALRFHLLTGGQRIQQLARATVADYDSDRDALRLLDNKGRRTQARVHWVPLLPEALEAMQAMQGDAGPYLVTFTAGRSGAAYRGMARRLDAIVEAMQGAGELPGGTFTLGDIRRTVETRLADAGVSRDTRAFLQSHGLGGVQVRHYDRHDYLPQSRAALETLQRLADNQSADIVPLHAPSEKVLTSYRAVGA